METTVLRQVQRSLPYSFEALSLPNAGVGLDVVVEINVGVDWQIALAID
jgi:hypothetical protein